MKKLIAFLAFVFVLAACSSNESDRNSNNDSFDRTALLTNWADNIIVPSYKNYQAKVAILVISTTAFNANPTEAGLQTLRASWIDAYKSYQKVTLFYIGKAADISLKESTNTFPTDAVGIENNIASGNYDLSLLSQFTKQGFPAVDFLINGSGTTNASIVAIYTTNINAVKYKQYLTAVTNRLKTNIDLVVTDWDSGYRDTFVKSSGNAVSSSVNKMTNLFVKNLEKDIRTGKLGIPAGLFSNGTLFPEKVEAFYKNDISKELLYIALQAQQDFFNGKYANSTTTGASLKAYLDYLNVVRNGQNLSAIINNQFAAVATANGNLNTSFSQQVIIDNSKMIATYDVLQQAVIYTKLDMMQALNISIDYVDGDGD